MKDSAGIGIHNKDRQVPGVQENRIHCLRAQAINPKQLPAEFVDRLGEEFRQGIMVPFMEKLHKRLEFFGFHPVIPA